MLIGILGFIAGLLVIPCGLLFILICILKEIDKEEK